MESEVKLNDLKTRLLADIAAGFLVLAMTVVGLMTSQDHPVHAAACGEAEDCDDIGGADANDPGDGSEPDDPGSSSDAENPA